MGLGWGVAVFIVAKPGVRRFTHFVTSTGALGIAAIANLSWTRRRDTALIAVIALHALVVVAIIAALRPALAVKASQEISMTISPGGARVVRGAPKVNLVVPDQAAMSPPDIVIENTPPANTIVLPVATGGPAVTVPAEAIGDSHSAPPLSDDQLKAARRATLRLLLSIAADGSVAKAVVENSTGLGSLDALAVAWVERHWRYKPALRDGVPIPVSTMAVVPF
jgi:outer membrane biosynthesis protein TonB